MRKHCIKFLTMIFNILLFLSGFLGNLLIPSYKFSVKVIADNDKTYGVSDLKTI